ARRRWRRGRHPKMVPAPDLLQRDFTAERSDLRWVADITEFACVDGKLYLAGIRDLHDRGLAGWSMGERQTTDLVVAALVMALGRREPSEDLLHYADHGCQYTSLEFTNRLADWELRASYGSVGDAFDNAAMETFWATLKKEVRHIGGLGDHHPLRAPHDPVRLHRGLLQPPAPPTPTRRPHPRRGLRFQPGSLIHRNPVSIRTGQLHGEHPGDGPVAWASEPCGCARGLDAG